MDKYEVDRQYEKVKIQSGTLKILLALIGISIIGIIITVILAILRVAISAMMITAGSLAILLLVGIVGYNAVRYKIKAFEYKRQLEKEQKKNGSVQ